MFVLSKGHAVAPLASIYADLGYFDRSVLKNSRSYDSILNGHPGPILPGVHISTGPLGQGLSVAQGFALAGKTSPKFDVFCMTGDGELQEGLIWEAVMYSAHKRLDNLCVLDRPERRPTGHRGPADLSLAGPGGGIRGLRVARAQRGRHTVRRCLRGARGVQARSTHG